MNSGHSGPLYGSIFRRTPDEGMRVNGDDDIRIAWLTPRDAVPRHGFEGSGYVDLVPQMNFTIDPPGVYIRMGFSGTKLNRRRIPDTVMDLIGWLRDGLMGVYTR